MPLILRTQVLRHRSTTPTARDSLRMEDIDTAGSVLAPGNDTGIGLFDSEGATLGDDDIEAYLRVFSGADC
jgi:hypothetical protein